jgi:hypothetical protein
VYNRAHPKPVVFRHLMVQGTCSIGSYIVVRPKIHTPDTVHSISSVFLSLSSFMVKKLRQNFVLVVGSKKWTAFDLLRFH